MCPVVTLGSLNCVFDFFLFVCFFKVVSRVLVMKLYTVVTTSINIQLPVDRLIKYLQGGTHCVSKSACKIYFAISKILGTSTLSICIGFRHTLTKPLSSCSSSMLYQHDASCSYHSRNSIFITSIRASRIIFV